MERNGAVMISGILILNKSEGITSHTAVSRVRRLLGADKAGHTGTLDPLATGVLPILLGRAVKASEYMISSDKHYRATLLLGITTDTEDITGEVLSRSEALPSEEAVLRAVAQMLGESSQIPPMYSAIKVGGKKLCDLARAGEVVEREPRQINVYKIDAKKLNDREYELDVVCSKGTYIRTLCADIGKRLGVGAVMKTLERVESAGFSLCDSVTLEELENMSEAERLSRIIPTERVFEGYRRVKLSDFFSRLAHSGAEIYLKKIGADIPLGERVTLYDGTGFFALGEVRDFDGSPAIKPIKQF